MFVWVDDDNDDGSGVVGVGGGSDNYNDDNGYDDADAVDDYDDDYDNDDDVDYDDDDDNIFLSKYFNQTRYTFTCNFQTHLIIYIYDKHTWSSQMYKYKLCTGYRFCFRLVFTCIHCSYRWCKITEIVLTI